MKLDKFIDCIKSDEFRNTTVPDNLNFLKIRMDRLIHKEVRNVDGSTVYSDPLDINPDGQESLSVCTDDDLFIEYIPFVSLDKYDSCTLSYLLNKIDSSVEAITGYISKSVADFLLAMGQVETSSMESDVDLRGVAISIIHNPSNATFIDIAFGFDYTNPSNSELKFFNLVQLCIHEVRVSPIVNDLNQAYTINRSKGRVFYDTRFEFEDWIKYLEAKDPK